jgi:hypothetical protein
LTEVVAGEEILESQEKGSSKVESHELRAQIKRRDVSEAVFDSTSEAPPSAGLCTERSARVRLV